VGGIKRKTTFSIVSLTFLGAKSITLREKRGILAFFSVFMPWQSWQSVAVESSRSVEKKKLFYF
jgi:hypothetical protein